MNRKDVYAFCALCIVFGSVLTGFYVVRGDSFLNPGDVRARIQPSADSDGDGVVNTVELEIGSDPMEKNPNLAVAAEHISDDKQEAENTVELYQLVYENPHNIFPQIKRYLNRNVRGAVTDEDLRKLDDTDGDGLITYTEIQVGSDPGNADTDADGLLDGWEYKEGVLIRVEYVPLEGASVDHKDAFILRILDEDDRYGMLDQKDEQFRTVFSNAPVSNPDGEQGIDLHISHERVDNPQKFGSMEHPYTGAYVFNIRDLTENESQWRNYGGGDQYIIACCKLRD